MGSLCRECINAGGSPFQEQHTGYWVLAFALRGNILKYLRAGRFSTITIKRYRITCVVP